MWFDIIVNKVCLILELVVEFEFGVRCFDGGWDWVKLIVGE